MKIEIVGIKVGDPRSTARKTLDLNHENLDPAKNYYPSIGEKIGKAVHEVLKKSDFISIRRID